MTHVPHSARDSFVDRYPTVDELVRAASELAERSPARCSLRRIGNAQSGEPLHLLSIGRGDRNVLVVAGAHSNEPAGSATTLALARHLAGRDSSAQPHIAWHFLLCLDPDSARLHVTQPREEQSFVGHHRRFFRPVAHEQPELAPSIRAPGDELPETRALMTTIDELRPIVQISLHGIDVGGTWVQVTQDVPGLSAPFAESAARLGIPLERGSFDTFFWPETDPGIFAMPPGEQKRFSSHVDVAATSTWFAPHRYGGRTVLIEVPMWTSPLVSDSRPHDAAPAVLRGCADRLREAGRAVARLVGAAGTDLADSRLMRAARGLSDLCPVLADDWTALAEDSAKGTHPPLTRAHVTSLEAQARRLPLRAASMLLHLLDLLGVAPVPHPHAQLAHVHDEALALVTGWCAEYHAALQAEWLPVRRQVEHQARTALTAAHLIATEPANLPKTRH